MRSELQTSSLDNMEKVTRVLVAFSVREPGWLVGRAPDS